ncbi:hypothetical protein BT96DRAFT_948434 [Gymnopus androsaceus JB14]|uniref:Uncharacterized protein n=1 Tax=Gymnopus androsaceus JB14 TaxID=1447944 RepID=A0A6A4GNL5_9AGAR|nr:hypothetical protein BT96DRAFT_948434 [Gymnopus androsaceus JB14]
MDSLVLAATCQRKLQYVGKFLDWADTKGLGPHNVLPPSKAVLCNYAASFASRLAGSTVRAKISAIKVEERAPVKEDHLCVLHEGLDLSGKCGKDHAIAAAAKALFAGQMQSGELLSTSPNPDNYNPSELPAYRQTQSLSAKDKDIPDEREESGAGGPARSNLPNSRTPRPYQGQLAEA